MKRSNPVPNYKSSNWQNFNNKYIRRCERKQTDARGAFAVALWLMLVFIVALLALGCAR